MVQSDTHLQVSTLPDETLKGSPMVMGFFVLGMACFLNDCSTVVEPSYEAPHLCVPSRGNTEQTSLCQFSKELWKHRVIHGGGLISSWRWRSVWNQALFIHDGGVPLCEGGIY